MTVKMKSVFENLASIKEEEAKAYRELAKAVDEDNTTSDAENKEGKPATKKAEKKQEVKQKEAEVTLEKLKTLLAEKSQAGHTDQIRELLKKFGAVKISAVKPEDYQSLYLAAEEIK